MGSGKPVAAESSCRGIRWRFPDKRPSGWFILDGRGGRLRVEELEVSQFRNIEQLTLTCPGDLHLFIGANAQGKTSRLESLYVLALGKPHRARSHRELIRWDQPTARLSVCIQRGERPHRL